jgi:hypothetical protein
MIANQLRVTATLLRNMTQSKAYISEKKNQMTELKFNMEKVTFQVMLHLISFASENLQNKTFVKMDFSSLQLIKEPI